MNAKWIRLSAVAALAALVVGGIAGASAWRGMQRTRALEGHMTELAWAMRNHADNAPRELFPPISSQPGVLFPDATALFPAYLDDPAVVVSPRHPNARALRRRLAAATIDGTANPAVIEQVGAESFHYLGYTVAYEITGMAWVGAYRDAAAAHVEGPLMEAETVRVAFPDGYAGPRQPPELTEMQAWVGVGPGSNGGNDIYRLRHGIERFMISDRAVSGPRASARGVSRLPLLIERPARIGEPIHVVYLDSHVARVPFGEFPNTGPFLEALESLRELAAATP